MRILRPIFQIALGLTLGIGITTMAATPYMSLTLPTPGVTAGPTWAQQINSAFVLIDQHTHAPGSGAQVPTAGLNINADLAFNGYNSTALRSARFSDNGAPLALGTDLRSVYSSGGNLYWNNGAGQQVQITSGAALNAASIGAIGGDYSTSSASEFYTSATQTFSFWQAANKPATVDAGNVILRQAGATSPQGVTLKSPNSLVSSYALTFPAALPGATSLVTFDTSGNVATSISASSPTFAGQLTAGGVTSANGDITAYRSGGASGVVYLNQAQTRYVYWDGTNYQMPGGQIQGLSDPTASSAAATKNYVDTHGSARAWAYLTTGSSGAVTVNKGFNVSSASYSGTVLTVNMTNAVPDTNCAVIAQASNGYVFTPPAGCASTTSVSLGANANFGGGAGTVVHIIIHD
jgi:hypothetical protein